MLSEVITISPKIQSGVPVFTNTRVPVKNFFDYVWAGDSIEEFLNDFPSVSRNQVLSLLSYIENFFTLRIDEHENNLA